MNSINAVLLVFVFSLLTGCSHYSDITGKVIDGATGKPIEGAVVVAEWMQFHGWLGEQQRELYKMIEANTDKEGKFSISGTTGMLLDPPVMIIYKEGYLPWRNDSIFPSSDRVNHEWNNNVTYKLNTYNSLAKPVLTYSYKDKFSLSQIESFIDSGLVGYDENSMPILTSKMRMLSSEQRSRDNTLTYLDFNGIVVDKDTGKPIEGAIIVALNQGATLLPDVTKVAESLSNKDGYIRISGKFTLLERPPPEIIVYKQGYMAQSSGAEVMKLGGELYQFKWENGYKFELSKWNSQVTHKVHFDHIYFQFAKKASEEGYPMLLDLIKWERDAK